jgi:NAD+ synthase/NAD+ synthase (glutamine-hydrolysing)
VILALGQINTTVGDFSGNVAKIIDYSKRAREAGAHLILFHELSICGYPPRDLVEKPVFLERNQTALEEVAAATRGIAVVCGFASPAHAHTGKRVMNSAALLRDGKIAFVQSKRLLPTYDVFDESRNFAPAKQQELTEFCGSKVALTICEDAWNDKNFWNRQLYGVDPVAELLGSGGQVLLNISSSPFHIGKREFRYDMLATIATHYRVPVAMVNQVGGNDSLVFDGSSLVVGPDGIVLAQAKSFEEDLILFDSVSEKGDVHERSVGAEASAYSALVLGTRDYVRKCGFKQAIVGLSGGIDSALTAAIAAEALGPENVIGVGMPSQYSSRGSIDDARQLAANLGIRFEIVPIADIFACFKLGLSGIFAGLPENETEENMQARLRGNILMAISNKFGALVLSTGNKSELGVGYCTLYGDMAGGLAVISDVPKTMVYRICSYVNSVRPVIPKSTMTKPPSAELRPNQFDSDSLPPYDILDQILEDYVEDLKSAEQIAETRKLDLELVRRVIKMIERSEYKRQQAAPGIKITEKAFGVGRRFPIAARHEV